MTQPIPIPIVRGEKTDSNADYIDSLPKNLIAVPKAVRGADAYLMTHPGLERIADVGATVTTGDRGGLYNERTGVHYRLIDGFLYRLGVDGGFDRIGTIAGTKKASFAYSFQSTLIISDGVAWRVLDNFKLTSYERLGFIDGCWIGGYYVMTDGARIWHTGIVDESKIDELAYAEAEQSPDKTLGVMATQDGLLMSFDRYTMQFFYNSATTPFAFTALPAKSINAGIVGTHAKAMLLGSVFILGGRKDESPSVYMVGTGDIQSVSTRTVDKIIAEYTEDELADAVLESRVEDRDCLLYVRLPRHTLVFNYAYAKVAGLDSAWSVLTSGNMESPWRACNGVFDPRMRKWIYGDTSSGKVYALDKTKSAQDGEPTEYEFSTPIIALRGRISKVEINTVPGYNTGPQSVFMSISNNLAQFNTEFVQAEEAQGRYGNIYILNGVGYFPRDAIITVRGVSVSNSNWSGLTAYVW
jgi:hypothetical protein